jgi:hypothetical protein
LGVFSAAFLAITLEVNRVVGNLKPGVPRIGKNETIELEIDKIADPGAAQTR